MFEDLDLKIAASAGTGASMAVSGTCTTTKCSVTHGDNCTDAWVAAPVRK